MTDLELKALIEERDIYRETLKEIATAPDPNGLDGYGGYGCWDIWKARTIAREALDA